VRTTSEKAPHLAIWLGGIALGAVAMYLADPAQGRRRRALAQDKMRSMSRKTGDAIDMAMRDAGNRISGLQAQAGKLFAPRSKPIDDHVLTARVRSKIGRKFTNTHSIEVTAQQGCVTLSGPVLTAEKAQLLELVEAIPGVTGVKDRLEVHQQDENISSLRSRDNRPYTQAWTKHGDWTPTVRVMSTFGGGMLGYLGMIRRSPLGALLALAAFGLLARSIKNADTSRIFGVSGNAQMVDVEKSIEIKASPETVFDIWSKYENFPYFMSHVEEVRDLGNRRSHWVVKGPAGIDIEWDSVLTECTRPTLLAWKSEPGAVVENAGWVRLEQAGDATRVTVQMSYSPPAGALGEGVASLLGSDPEQELEGGLVQMKSFIESSKPRGEAAITESASGQILH
jgi:uncharacterized membrane protein